MRTLDRDSLRIPLLSCSAISHRRNVVSLFTKRYNAHSKFNETTKKRNAEKQLVGLQKSFKLQSPLSSLIAYFSPFFHSTFLNYTSVALHTSVIRRFVMQKVMQNSYFREKNEITNAITKLCDYRNWVSLTFAYHPGDDGQSAPGIPSPSFGPFGKSRIDSFTESVLLAR